MFRPNERLALYAAASDKSALHKGRLIWLSAVAVGRRSGEKESGITRITALSLWTEGITLDLHRPLALWTPLNPHFNAALSAGRSFIGQKDGLSNETRFIQPTEKGSGQLRES